MRHLSLIAIGLLAATGCVANDEETDGIDDAGEIQSCQVR
jgi:hypothetical protein